MRSATFATRAFAVANASAICAAQRRFNATATPAEETPTTTQQQDDTTAAPARKRFNASVSFKIAPEKIDSDNCPSASEIKELLPTADELYNQLPSPAEVRAMYGLDRPGAGRAPPTPEMYANVGVMASLKRSVLGGLSKDSDLNKNADGTPIDGTNAAEKGSSGLSRFFDRFSLHPEATTAGPHAMTKVNNANTNNVAGSSTSNNAVNKNADEDEALWPDCDTPEDIINEERFGGEGEEAPKPTGEHVALAWKALMYGTALATLMCVLSAGFLCWYMGFGSFAQIKEHLQNRKGREIEKLKQEAMANKKDGNNNDGDNADEVHVYEIDLTQPSTLMSQFEGLMSLIETLATEESEKEEAEKKAKAAAVVAPTVTPAPAVSTAGTNLGWDVMTVKDDTPAVNPLKPTKRNYSL